jgi:hypothetical protein
MIKMIKKIITGFRFLNIPDFLLKDGNKLYGPKPVLNIPRSFRHWKACLKNHFQN